MKMPWHGRAGLARSTSILATMLLVSLGLCGVNFGVISLIGAVFKTKAPALTDAAGALLIITAFVESLGIIVGAGGLVILALIAIFLWIARRPSDTKDKEETD